ncbi:MAG: alanine--glyoxylate aminotransferase family protein [Dehalococcoidia bacterium]|nr:alanine--glyoxylate aminotransferase family protein [Dehalococcoidia bacterium]
MKSIQLRIPGPTPCPPDVLEATGKQMINHRGPEFAAMVNKITVRLKEFYQTKNDVFILTGSGTGSMEAAIVNVLSPGDKVLSVSNGEFGDRFGSMAGTFGANVTKLNFEHGLVVDPDKVKQALQADPGIEAVLVTHNETSTGVTNDLATISKIVKGAGKLLIVDGISSVGSIDLPTDAWGCDVVVTGSQKGWMVPPGLAFISMSQEAWKAHATARMPRFYWDVTRAKKMLEKGQTPWTPAVSIFFALEVALEDIAKEGFSNVIARHARVARKARSDAKSLGLSLLVADESYASNTVTAIKSPEGVDCSKLLKLLQEEYGVVLSGGQGSLTGKIFRIGHLGWVNEADIAEVTKALKLALPKVGFKV